MVKEFFPEAHQHGELIRATLLYPAERYRGWCSGRLYALVQAARQDVFPAFRLTSAQFPPKGNYGFGECYVTLRCLGYSNEDLLGLLSGEGLPEVERRYTVLTDGYAREKQSKVNGENWHSRAVDVMKAWVGENNAEAFLDPKGMQRLHNGHETRVPDVLVYDEHDMKRCFFADPKLDARQLGGSLDEFEPDSDNDPCIFQSSV